MKLKRKTPLAYYSGMVLCGLCLTVSSQLLAAEKITPSHVFQKTQQIRLGIDVLRDTIGLTDVPLEAEPQASKTPLHVYSKGLEVLEKISRAERKLGMDPVKVGEIPLKAIKPSDVAKLADKILAEIKRMNKQLAIKTKIGKVDFVDGKTPSDVYENYWNASYALDGLTGKLNPSDVFRNVHYILDEIELIATRLNIKVGVKTKTPDGKKSPKDVAQQGLLALYKVASLQRRLGMDPSGIPHITLVRITPSDVYDISNMLMAEVMRIKIFLGIPLPRGERPLPTGKKPTDVFAEMVLVSENIAVLVDAAVEQPK